MKVEKRMRKYEQFNKKVERQHLDKLAILLPQVQAILNI